jgi:hypothetical protein
MKPKNLRRRLHKAYTNRKKHIVVRTRLKLAGKWVSTQKIHTVEIARLDYVIADTLRKLEEIK